MSKTIPESVANKIMDTIVESICSTIGEVFPSSLIEVAIPQIAEVGQKHTRDAFCTICDLLGIESVEEGV